MHCTVHCTPDGCPPPLTLQGARWRAGRGARLLAAAVLTQAGAASRAPGHACPTFPRSRGPALARRHSQGHQHGCRVTQPGKVTAGPRTCPATSVFITTTKREGLKSARSKPCPVSGFRSATRNANSKTFPSDTTLSQPTHATSQTTTQLPQSTTNLPHVHVHVLYVVYMTFYVICHILNSCMPNWQQLAVEGAVMASLPDDGHDGQTTACRLRGQTEYLI